ncbi:MAG: hypothetical protein AAGI07_19010 [Bacteroidota bacterium]
MKLQVLYRKWLFTDPIGLVIIGTHSSILGEAKTLKQNETPFILVVHF